MRPQTIYPFPEKPLHETLDAGKVKRVVVAEMNMGQLILDVERLVAGRAPVYGLNRIDGETLTPFEVKDFIREVHK